MHAAPPGYQSITPFLVVRDPDRLVSFLRAALGGELVERLVDGDGRVVHAEVRVGDSIVMVGGTGDGQEPVPAVLYHYVSRVDDAFRAAVAAGATVIREPADQIYGDRSAGVVDPEGVEWWLATRVEDVSPGELARRARG